MAGNDTKLDPDIGVALWVNITIPILCVAMLLAAAFILYFLPYEIDVKRLELWAEKLRFRKDKEAGFRNVRKSRISNIRCHYFKDQADLEYDEFDLASKRSKRKVYSESRENLLSFESNV